MGLQQLLCVYYLHYFSKFVWRIVCLAAKAIQRLLLAEKQPEGKQVWRGDHRLSMSHPPLKYQMTSFLHQFIVKSLKNRAADVELENNFTNGMGHDIQRLPIRFNEVIIVLCAELNLTSNYGFMKDKIFLFMMRFFSLLHLDF